MAKKLKRQYAVEELYNPQIDITRDAYLYGRQSGRDQVIQNIQSHISQTVELIEYTKRELGYKDDGTTGKVTLFVENQVVDADGNVRVKDASGTWPIDRRPGLKTICDTIEYGTEDRREVGVVIAEFVDRLFRDEDRIDSNVFIKICKENDCFVHISSKRMTYNFANPQHAELFRMEVLMAAAYIENHVRGTMHRRRNLAARSGLWVGVGSIPVGYITERDRDNPRYGMFIIYEPHAKIVRWIFTRFVELGYDFIAFKRELQAMSYIFPPFESWVNPADTSKCNLRVQNGGYSFCETTLEKILTNEVYIGTYKREGVTRLHNHPAIVEEELFWSAYDHLKDFRPDGTPTNRVRLVRYSQRVPSERKPLLLFTSSQPNVSVCFGKNLRWHHYKARLWNGMTREDVVNADADTIENAVVTKLFEKLQYVDIGDLEQKRKAMLQEKATRVKKLERDIQTIDEEIDTLTENMGKIKTAAVVEKLEKQIAKLLDRRADADAEVTKITQAYQDITLGTLEEELKDLEQFWDERSFGLRKSLLRLLIKEAKLDYISPRFYSMTIEWTYGDWGIEQAIIDKGKGNKQWSEEENNILRALYKDKDQVEIMQALPQRSWRGIINQADKVGVREGTWKPKTIKNINVSLQDLAFLEKSGITLEQFQDANGVIWYFGYKAW
ncbi:MAG TPA: recombinase family protein [Ktedonobacteraceae bacterium]|nr:recombinase family protein [Ktedonobacteraceae bacterium]